MVWTTAVSNFDINDGPGVIGTEDNNHPQRTCKDDKKDVVLRYFRFALSDSPLNIVLPYEVCYLSDNVNVKGDYEGERDSYAISDSEAKEPRLQWLTTEFGFLPKGEEKGKDGVCNGTYRLMNHKYALCASKNASGIDRDTITPAKYVLLSFTSHNAIIFLQLLTRILRNANMNEMFNLSTCDVIPDTENIKGDIKENDVETPSVNVIAGHRKHQVILEVAKVVYCDYCVAIKEMKEKGEDSTVSRFLLDVFNHEDMSSECDTITSDEEIDMWSPCLIAILIAKTVAISSNSVGDCAKEALIANLQHQAQIGFEFLMQFMHFHVKYAHMCLGYMAECRSMMMMCEELLELYHAKVIGTGEYKPTDAQFLKGAVQARYGASDGGAPCFLNALPIQVMSLVGSISRCLFIDDSLSNCYNDPVEFSEEVQSLLAGEEEPTSGSEQSFIIQRHLLDGRAMWRGFVEHGRLISDSFHLISDKSPSREELNNFNCEEYSFDQSMGLSMEMISNGPIVLMRALLSKDTNQNIHSEVQTKNATSNNSNQSQSVVSLMSWTNFCNRLNEYFIETETTTDHHSRRQELEVSPSHSMGVNSNNTDHTFDIPYVKTYGVHTCNTTRIGIAGQDVYAQCNGHCEAEGLLSSSGDHLKSPKGEKSQSAQCRIAVLVNADQMYDKVCTGGDIAALEKLQALLPISPIYWVTYPHLLMYGIVANGGDALYNRNWAREVIKRNLMSHLLLFPDAGCVLPHPLMQSDINRQRQLQWLIHRVLLHCNVQEGSKLAFLGKLCNVPLNFCSAPSAPDALNVITGSLEVSDIIKNRGEISDKAASKRLHTILKSQQTRVRLNNLHLSIQLTLPSVSIDAYTTYFDGMRSGVKISDMKKTKGTQASVHSTPIETSENDRPIVFPIAKYYSPFNQDTKILGSDEDKCSEVKILSKKQVGEFLPFAALLRVGSVFSACSTPSATLCALSQPGTMWIQKETISGHCPPQTLSNIIASNDHHDAMRFLLKLQYTIDHPAVVNYLLSGPETHEGGFQELWTSRSVTMANCKKYNSRVAMLYDAVLSPMIEYAVETARREEADDTNKFTLDYVRAIKTVSHSMWFQFWYDYFTALLENASERLVKCALLQVAAVTGLDNGAEHEFDEAIYGNDEDVLLYTGLSDAALALRGIKDELEELCPCLLKVENEGDRSTDEASLDARFEGAQKAFGKVADKHSNEVKLQFYALFKQAKVGNVNISKPWAVDIAGRAKYDAWLKLNSMSQEDAMARYVEEWEKLKGLNNI